MFTISKTFQFCYGHRLINDNGRCRLLHGHTARATFVLNANELDEHGMVIHFDKLKNTVGKWISENLDHTTLLSANDPLANVLKKAGEKFQEVSWNPTAENIAKMLFEKTLSFDLPIQSVEVWESETSKATYSR